MSLEVSDLSQHYASACLILHYFSARLFPFLQFDIDSMILA
jgi:hypothetical protein